MSVARVCRHRRVRIGQANFLVLAALPILLFDLDVILVEHLDHVTLDKALPADVGSDERSVNVHDLTGRDLGLQTRLNRALEDLAEPRPTAGESASGSNDREASRERHNR